jgi:1,4-dihydroxy-6-naphthoate synthase
VLDNSPHVQASWFSEGRKTGQLAFTFFLRRINGLIMNTPFTVAHSPDPDDAFMYYGLAKELVTLPDYAIQHRIADIHSLNQLAMQGVDEVTAISAAAYPLVADKYRIMTVGASVGRGYGPIVVAPQVLDLQGKRIAVPGRTTTARLLSQLLLPPFEEVEIPFDQIFEAIKAGEVAAGVLIHEGQLTYPEYGMVKIADLAEMWKTETGYPIPLGLDVIARRLPETVAVQFSEVLAESILLAYEQLEDSTAYAREFGRGISAQLNKQFVQMYVNMDTLDFGEDCQRSLELLYQRAFAKGLLEKIPVLDFVTPQRVEVIQRIRDFKESSVYEVS